LANLATSLFEHGAITTTEAKARVLRPYAERLITKAKRGDLHNRRQVLSVIRDKSVVHVLFTEIGPRFAARQGGYTRITKIGPRKGDNAPMAVIALVTEELTSTPRSTKPAVGTRATAEPAVTDVEEDTSSVAVGDGAVDDVVAAEAAPGPPAEETVGGEPAEDETAPVETDGDSAADESAGSQVESMDTDADATPTETDANKQ